MPDLTVACQDPDLDLNENSKRVSAGFRLQKGSIWFRSGMASYCQIRILEQEDYLDRSFCCVEVIILQYCTQTQHANEGMPWRPPLSLQNSINNEFFRRMSKHSAGQKLQMFTNYMCPYVSGLPLHQFRKLPPHKDHVEGMLVVQKRIFCD